MDFRERRYLVVGIVPKHREYVNHMVDVCEIAKTIHSTKIKYINSMPRDMYFIHSIPVPRLLISCHREHYNELIDILNSKFNEYASLYGFDENNCPFQYKEIYASHTTRYRHKCVKQLGEKLKNCYNVIDYALNESFRSEDVTEAIELLRKHNTTGASVIKLSNSKTTERELINKILDNYELLVDKFITCEKLLKSSNESIEALINMKV